MYQILEIMAGLAAPGPDFLDKTFMWLKVQLISELFFYTGLTAVKLAFLLFFKRLGHNVNRFNWFWWPVVGFVLAQYFICIGTVEYRCLLPTVQDLVGYCSTRESGDFTSVTLKFNCAMDVLSDFLSKSTFVLAAANLITDCFGRQLSSSRSGFCGTYELPLPRNSPSSACSRSRLSPWPSPLHVRLIWLPQPGITVSLTRAISGCGLLSSHALVSYPPTCTQP